MSLTGTCELYLGGLASYLFWYDSTVQLCGHLHLWAFLEIIYLKVMPSYTVQSANQSGDINPAYFLVRAGSLSLLRPVATSMLLFLPARRSFFRGLI